MDGVRRSMVPAVVGSGDGGCDTGAGWGWSGYDVSFYKGHFKSYRLMFNVINLKTAF